MSIKKSRLTIDNTLTIRKRGKGYRVIQDNYFPHYDAESVRLFLKNIGYPDDRIDYALAHMITEPEVNNSLPQNIYQLLEHNSLHNIYSIDIRATWYSSLTPYKDFANLLHTLMEDNEAKGYYLKTMTTYNDHYIVVFQHR